MPQRAEDAARGTSARGTSVRWSAVQANPQNPGRLIQRVVLTPGYEQGNLPIDNLSDSTAERLMSAIGSAAH
ncbi:MAG: hypothetical protein KIT72_08465 [Polyangiaceae bacterium]|nr:hypothetical protein [Polyangiaceae bacterium]